MLCTTYSRTHVYSGTDFVIAACPFVISSVVLGRFTQARSFKSRYVKENGIWTGGRRGIAVSPKTSSQPSWMCSVQPLPGIFLRLCWSAIVMKPHRHQQIFQQPCRNVSRKLRYRWAVCPSGNRQGPTGSKKWRLIQILPKSIKKMLKLLVQNFYATKYNTKSNELIFKKFTLPQWQSEDICQFVFSKIF